MATFDLESSVNKLPDTSIIPNYPGHPVVKAKILDFAMFRGFEPLDIKDKLKQYFNSCNMLVIKHTDTPQPVPIHLMTLEDLVDAISQKLKSEPQAIVGDKDLNAMQTIQAKVNAQDEDSASAMEDLQLLAYGCVLEAMVTRIIKRGALYLNPFTQKPVLLLGNRGLFVTDKQRVAAAEARQKKAELKASKALKTGQLKDDTLHQKQSAHKRSSREDKGTQSAGSLDDASVHESPYSSEWERASGNSGPSTPILFSAAAPTIPQVEPLPINQDPIADSNDALPTLILPHHNLWVFSWRHPLSCPWSLLLLICKEHVVSTWLLLVWAYLGLSIQDLLNFPQSLQGASLGNQKSQRSQSPSDLDPDQDPSQDLLLLCL